MVRVDLQKWKQSVDDLRRMSLTAEHPRTRERFQALYLIASGQFNATQCAQHLGRKNQTVHDWVHTYNHHGPDALAYRRTGGRTHFTRQQAQEIVDTCRDSQPHQHGLPGHLWTLKKLKVWILNHFGISASRNGIRRVLQQAGLTYKKIKKVLGKAKREKRVAHIQQLMQLYEQVRTGEVMLIYVDESHFHRDMDHGYTWGLKGERIWRLSDCPGLSERLNWYGAYDFTNGECLIWQEGSCNGQQTIQFLEKIKEWRGGKKGKIVIVWDNAPWHIAKIVKAKAKELGMELVFLPGYSPDLNPIERLWDWMREEVTRGHCHATLQELNDACQAFIQTINQDPIAVIDRLWPKFDLIPDYEDKLPFPS